MKTAKKNSKRSAMRGISRLNRKQRKAISLSKAVPLYEIHNRQRALQRLADENS